MFKYEFMRLAFIVGTFVAISIPFIGSIMVYKGMSMIGESLSHISLVGVILGVMLGFSPTLGALIVTIIASLSIFYLNDLLKNYKDISLLIMTSLGIGLAGLLLSFVSGPSNFESFLFGSILTISSNEAILAIILSIVVIGLSLYFFRSFFLIAFDEEIASLSGVNVEWMNFLFMLLGAVSISITSRIIGALIVSSLMIIPIASALLVSQSYKQTLFIGTVLSVLSVWIGLYATYLIPTSLKPGSMIVLTSILLFIFTVIYKVTLKNRKVNV